MHIPDSERERWSDVGDRGPGNTFQRDHITEEVPQDPEPTFDTRDAGRSYGEAIAELGHAMDEFGSGISEGVAAARQRLLDAAARVEHEDGAHDDFIDAPDWYWWIAGHLIGWKRDVYAWVGLFVLGLFLGIMLRGALA